MPRPVFPLELVGPHELKLREEIEQFQLPAEVEPLSEPVTIILFTNRSGSSLVAEYLRATGRFRGMGEPLNPGFVLAEMKNLGIGTFHAYLRSRIERDRTADSMFGMKASLQQVTMLMRAGAIPRYFGDIRWVFVQRRDIVAQAVSFVIASQTKRWESFAAGNGEPAEYGFDQIRRKVEALSTQNAAIEAFFSVLGVQPCRMVYEEFCIDPLIATTRLASMLGISNARVDATGLRRQKQGDDTNAAYCHRFREEYMRWLLERQ